MTREEALFFQLEGKRAQVDRLVAVLCSIKVLLPPPDVRTEDGSVFQYNDPAPMERLLALRDRVAAIEEAVAGEPVRLPMTEERAREILRLDADDVRADGGLLLGDPYVDWSPTKRSEYAIVDSSFCTADKLEAIAWWMRNKASRG